MALKHLKNAIELLNAGMSINDIRTIITMKDEPEQETEKTQETDEPEQEKTQDEPKQTEQATKPEPKKNPYQEKAKNSSSPETLIDELNKIF